jgi:hypothetical protein
VRLCRAVGSQAAGSPVSADSTTISRPRRMARQWKAAAPATRGQVTLPQDHVPRGSRGGVPDAKGLVIGASHQLTAVGRERDTERPTSASAQQAKLVATTGVPDRRVADPD